MPRRHDSDHREVHVDADNDHELEHRLRSGFGGFIIQAAWFFPGSNLGRLFFNEIQAAKRQAREILYSIRHDMS
jgi:hypothetical protein